MSYEDIRRQLRASVGEDKDEEARMRYARQDQQRRQQEQQQQQERKNTSAQANQGRGGSEAFQQWLIDMQSKQGPLANYLSTQGMKDYVSRPISREERVQSVIDNLNDDSWGSYQRDSLGKADLDYLIRQADNLTAEMMKRGDRMAYQNTKDYADWLRNLQGLYDDRASYFGQFQNEDEYKLVRGVQAGQDQAAARGESYNDYYQRTAQGAEKANEAYQAAQQQKAQLQQDLVQMNNYYYASGQVIANGKVLKGQEAEAYIQQKRDELAYLDQDIQQKAHDAQYAEQVASYAEMGRYSDLQYRDDFQTKVAAGMAAFQRDKANREAGNMSDSEIARAAAWGAGDTSGMGGLGTATILKERQNTSAVEPTEDWSKDELNEFFYLYATNPTEAGERARSLNARDLALQYNRQAKGVEDWTNQSGWNRLAAWAAGVLSSPANLADYYARAMEYSLHGYVMPHGQMTPADYANTMSAAAARYLNETYTLPENIPSLGGKGLGDLFQLSQSIAQSWATAALGGGATNLLFFGSAANQTFADAKARGASDGQALILGALSGAAEVLGETLSVEHLIDLKDPAGLRQTIGNIFAQSGIEASEEAFTTVMNRWADELVMRDKSELQQAIRDNMAKGMSPEEAEKTAWREWTEGVLFDAFGGFLSGGISAGGKMGISSAIHSGSAYSGGIQTRGMSKEERQDLRRTTAQEVINYGKLADEGTKARSMADKAQARLDKRGSITNRQATKLSKETVKAIRSADRTTLEDAVRARLQQTGDMSAADLDRTAKSIVDRVTGDKTGGAWISSQEMRVYNELEAQLSGVSSENWLQADKLKTNQAREQKMQSIRNLELKDSGKTVKVTHAEMKDGKLAFAYMENGKEKVASQEDLKLDTAQADTLKMLTQILGEDAAAAYNTMNVGTMAFGDVFDVMRYASAFATVRDVFGATGVSETRMLASSLRNGLTNGQALQAWTIGKNRGAELRTEQKQSRAGTGEVSLDGTTIRHKDGSTTTFKAVKDQEKVRKSKKFQAVQAIAESLKIDMVLYDGEGGQNIGMYGNGVIYLDWTAMQSEDAKSSDWVMFRTLSHELTHFIQQNAKKEYRELRGYITRYLSESKNLDFNDLVAQKMAREYDPETGKLMSYDKAVDEVMADACETMLRDSQYVQDLMQENQSLWEKIRSFIRNFLAKIEASDAAAKELQPVIKELREIWDRGLKTAVESRTDTVSVGSTEGQQAVEKLSAEEVGNRAEYESRQAKVWDETVDKAEKMLLEKYRRESAVVDADTLQHSLKPVAPVQPTSNAWSRTHDTAEAMEAYPNLWNVAAEESEKRNPTQISSTQGTYRNIYKILQREGFNGKILDASSGLGLGTKVGREEFGFDVDDIEPYPDASYKPRYTDYSRLHKKYDAIISSAVLNVLPQDQRDALVVKMGELLNPGGRMFITTRGKDVETLGNTGKNIHLGNMEWIETVKGSYQKGFTQAELKAYLEDALGPGFTVELSNAKNGGKFNNNTSIVVMKDNKKAAATGGIEGMSPEEYANSTSKEVASENMQFSFGGSKAKTANTVKRQMAQNYEREGMSRSDIFLKTGWFRGLDRQWRFEIDNSEMKLADAYNPNVKAYELDQLIEHPELFNAYPELKRVHVLVEKLGPTVGGVYYPGQRLIRVNDTMFDDKDFVVSILAHEIQHAIQNIEGFTPGASVEYWENADWGDREWLNRLIRNKEKDLQKAAKELDEALKDTDYDSFQKQQDERIWNEEITEDEAEKEYKRFVEKNVPAGGYLYGLIKQAQRDIEQARKQLDAIKSPADKYRNTAGEIEARDVQERLTYNKAERRLRMPNIPDNGVYYARNESRAFSTDVVNGDELQRSVRSDNRTDRELLRDLYDRIEAKVEARAKRNEAGLEKAYQKMVRDKQSVIEELKAEQAKALETFLKRQDRYDGAMRAVSIEMTKLENMVNAGANQKEISAQRAKVTAAETRLANATAALTQARDSEEIQKLLSRERQLQQTRTRNTIRESVNSREMKRRVTRAAGELYEMLATNSDKLHVPEILKEPLGDFLQSLDFTSKRALAGGEETKADQRFGARLQQIRNILENQQRYLNGEEAAAQDLGGYLDISEDSLQFLRDCTDMINQALAENRGYTINQMNAEQLRDLANFLSNLKSAIRKMNSFMANERYASVREAADADITEMEAMGRAGNLAENRALNEFLWKNGTPYYIFKRMGAGAESIFQGFTRGWAQMAFDARKIIDFTEQAYTDKEVKQWKKETHNFTLEDGSKITMTTAQIMELSQLLGRQQAVQHLQAGGMRIGDIQTRTGAKGDTKHYHLTDNDLQQILGALSERQMKVARDLQHFMAEQGAEWGNEVSMKRFGYRFYTEGAGYYPIVTDALDRPMADTDAQKNSMFRLLNLSSSKSLNPKANNALVVGDIFDTFTDHMADMAKLHGMGLPILDAIKWFNFKEKTKNEDGTIDTRTLQGAMEQAFGSAAGSYFRTMMKDINGQTENGDRGTGLANMAIGAYKAQAVAANLRVALLQPTAYLRAATVLKPKYMLAAFGNFKASVFAVRAAEAAWKEAMQHSGEMIWKDIGGYDTDLSRSMRSQIQHSDSVREKIVNGSMFLAEWGDKLTWGRLWAACKMQARAENKALTGQALMDATEKLFREVIYSSQVMDSTLTRSELMRGRTMGSKVLTAFMAEPTLSVNIVMDAASEYRNDERKYGKAEAWKRNGKRIGKAFMIYLTTQTAAALVESFADALRDDDDEELWKKYLEALLGEDNAKRILGEELGKNAKGVLMSAYADGNLLQDYLFLNKLPFIKDLASLLTGFKSRNMMTEGAENLLNVYKIWRETKLLADGVLEKPTSVTYYGKMTPWGKIYKSLQAVSQLSGTPLYGLSRDVVAIWNTIMNGRKDEWKIRTYDDSKSTDKLLAALRSGKDTSEARAKLIAAGMDEKDINSAVRSEVKTMFLGDDKKEGISEEDAVQLLVDEAGMRQRDAEKQVQNWSSEKDTGVKYDDIKEKYLAGDITAEEAERMRMEYGGQKEEAAHAAIREWECEKETGFKYDELDDAFLDGDITEKQAVAYRIEYGGQDPEAAQKTVNKWKCEKETGYRYDEIRENYVSGKLSRDKAADMMAKYGGKERDSALKTLYRYQFVGTDESLEGITEAAAVHYYADIYESGMSKKTFFSAWSDLKEFKGDLDANGKSIPYSKMDKMIDYIGKLSIPDAQKDLLFLMYYDKKQLSRTSWH